MIDIKDLAREVQHMRKLQQKYFRDKSPQSLRESKDAERRLDERCAEILRQDLQPGLFEGDVNA